MNNTIKILSIYLPILILTACNSGGSSRGVNDTAYGQYVESASAGSDLTKPQLQAFFESQVACSGLSVSFLCTTYNKPYISNTPIFGLSTSGKTVNNFVTSTEPSITSISRYQLFYTTPGAPYMFGGQSTSQEVASGLVLVPNGLAESQIKGVVLYFHGTVVSKAGVPSGYGSNQTTDPVGSSGFNGATNYQNILASIYANSGYIVVAPDYVGQGYDINPVHPYVLLPKTNALSGLDMLPALKTFLGSVNIDINKINNSTPNFFITSYSEGGAYALWASYLAQNGFGNIISNSGLTLKRTVGSSGAYDLSNVMLPFAFSNTPNNIIPESSIPNGVTPESNPWSVSPGCDPSAGGYSTLYCSNPGLQATVQATAQIQIALSKPPLSAYMINALVTYDYTPVGYNLVMMPAYAQQQTCINAASLTDPLQPFVVQSCASVPIESGGTGGAYSVMTLFNPNNLNNSQIETQLIAAAAGSTGFFVGTNTSFAQVFAGLESGEINNSISTFVHQELLQDQGIMALIKAADIYNWTTYSPISLLYLKYDSTVTNVNTTQGACNPNAPSVYSNSPGLVTCNAINNTQICSGSLVPMYMNHANANGILQLASLNQIESN